VIERLQVPNAPRPAGPYSTAYVQESFSLSQDKVRGSVSGQMQAQASIDEQTRLVLNNVRTILNGCGADLEHVVKCSVFLLDPKDFSAMNAVYAEVFGGNKPARTTVATGMVARV